jgi:hypothetical protein
LSLGYLRLNVVFAALAFAAIQAVPALGETSALPPERSWIVQAGAGSPHAWNFVGLTRELSAGHFRPFATIGFGSFLVGGGATYYTNPGGNGLVLAAVGGLAGAQISAALDLRFSPKAGLVLGVSYGSYFLQYTGPLPIASLQVRF